MVSMRRLAGARRDEEKSRAKERIFSFRTASHALGPEEPAPRIVEPLQRPKKAKGESIRVFPISNWTELDVWQYIHLERHPDRAALFCRPSAPPWSAMGMLLMVDDDRFPVEAWRSAGGCARSGFARWVVTRSPAPSKATASTLACK